MGCGATSREVKESENATRRKKTEERSQEDSESEDVKPVGPRLPAYKATMGWIVSPKIHVHQQLPNVI